MLMMYVDNNVLLINILEGVRTFTICPGMNE